MLQSRIDSRSANAMFDILRKKLNFSASYSRLQSILFHLLQMPCQSAVPRKHCFRLTFVSLPVYFLAVGNGPASLRWDLVDRIIQQIVLQNKDGDCDVAPLDVDVKKITKQCV